MSDAQFSAINTDDHNTPNKLQTSSRKRRSFVFKRRSINRQDEVANNEISHEPNDVAFDLPEYISSLKKECSDWKQLLKERKSQRRHLAKQELSLGNEVKSDFSVLNDDERKFLLNRPNYEKVAKNINNLIPLTVKISQLHSHLEHVHKSIIDCVEEKVGDITKDLENHVKDQ